MLLTDGQQLYMRYLRDRKSPASNREIAKHFYVQQKSVVVAMKPMIDAGLVRVLIKMSGRKKIYLYEAVQKINSLMPLDQRIKPVPVVVEVAKPVLLEPEIRQTGPAYVRFPNLFARRV